MNLIEQKIVKLSHGTLQLRIYNHRSYLTIIPDEPGRKVFKREYAYFEADRARADFDTIQEAAA